MNKYLFTFGQGHQYVNRHQIIYASYPDTAAAKMSDIHGRNWCDQYTQKTWEMYKERGFFQDNLPLNITYRCKEEK